MKKVLSLFIGLKIITYLILFLSPLLLPYATDMFERNFLYPAGHSHTFYSPFESWDAQHYLYLAEKGYAADQLSNAFFPLYPLFVSGLALLVQNTLLAGLIVSNLFSFLAMYYLYKFVRAQWSESVSVVFCVILLLSPTAFYLSLVYTESLFLFLISGFFYYLYKKHYFWAGLFTFFIPLARPTGVFIILPFLLFFLFDQKKIKKRLRLPSFNEKVYMTFYPQIVSLLFPLLGLLSYFIFMKLTTGDPWTALEAQRRFIGGYSLENIFVPMTFIQNLFSSDLTVHYFTKSIIDRALFVGAVILLPFIYRRDKTLFAYTLPFVFIPFFGSFMGYSRYLLVAFPLFLVLSLWLHREKYHFILFPLLALLYAFQILFTVLYGLNYWVS